MTESFEWTQDQTDFFEAFKEWLNNPETPMSLSGSAGTGKTTIVIESIKYVLNCTDRVIGVCAPTNKAVRVLADKLTGASIPFIRGVPTLEEIDEGSRLFLGTIHQFLGSVPDAEVCSSCLHSLTGSGDSFYCGKHGKGVKPFDSCDEFQADEDKPVFTFKERENRPFYLCGFIAVDESSMVTSDQDEMIQESRPDDCALLYIGDIFQVFPVEENPQISPSFDQPLTFELDKVVRYDGRILRIATDIRDTMKPENREFFYKPYRFPSGKEIDYTYVQGKKDTKYQSDWFRLALKDVPEALGANNDSYMRIGVYRNRTMEDINHRIRMSIFGNTARNEIFPNEWFFCHGSMFTHLSPEVFLNGATDDQNELLIEYREQSKIDRYSDDSLHLLSQIQNQGICSFYGLANGYDVFINYAESRSFTFPVPVLYESVAEFFPALEQSYTVLDCKQFKGYPLKLVTLTYAQQEKLVRNLQQISNFAVRMSREHGIHHRNIQDYLIKIKKCLKYVEKPLSTSFIDPLDEKFSYSFLPESHRPDTDSSKWYRRRVFTKLAPGMALTLHKLQGSTINHVYLDYSDCMAGVMYRKSDPLELRLDTLYRLTYTGLTRAKESVKVFSTGSEFSASF